MPSRRRDAPSAENTRAYSSQKSRWESRQHDTKHTVHVQQVIRYLVDVHGFILSCRISQPDLPKVLVERFNILIDVCRTTNQSEFELPYRPYLPSAGVLLEISMLCSLPDAPLSLCRAVFEALRFGRGSSLQMVSSALCTFPTSFVVSWLRTLEHEAEELGDGFGCSISPSDVHGIVDFGPGDFVDEILRIRPVDAPGQRIGRVGHA
eukprot:scaffold350_cov333-Pavlova_lutheri.AAC.18